LLPRLLRDVRGDLDADADDGQRASGRAGLSRELYLIQMQIQSLEPAPPLCWTIVLATLLAVPVDSVFWSAVDSPDCWMACWRLEIQRFRVVSLHDSESTSSPRGLRLPAVETVIPSVVVCGRSPNRTRTARAIARTNSTTLFRTTVSGSRRISTPCFP